MEIEDIINKVRFTTPDDKSARPRSLRESTDTSIISKSKCFAESVASLEAFSPDERQKQAYVDEKVQRQAHGAPRRRRVRKTSETYDSRQLVKSWPLQQPQQHEPVSYRNAMPPIYYSAYMVVPMPASRMAPHPGSSDVPQRQHYPPESPQRTYKEEKHPAEPHPRGVKLPPLPEPLRRAQTTSKRRPLQPKEKKKRVRVAPVIHEYDHLSVAEAIQELARRNIHITDMQQIDISKANLVRLLQRADRNNNKGSGNPREPERRTTPA